MGSAFSNLSSSNHLNNIAEIITDVINSNTQDCKLNATQVQQIDVSDCTIDISNVDFTQTLNVDFNCVQGAEQNTKIAEQLNVQLQQIAKSLLDGLSFQFGSSIDAENFITNHAKLATTVVNNITQNCNVSAGQYQGIKCTGKSNALITNVSFDQVIKSVSKCAQSGKTFTDIEANITEFIEQTAISEQKGLSFDILIVVFILIFVGAGIFILNKGLDWRFIAVAAPIVIIIVYLIIANKKNLWPFK